MSDVRFAPGLRVAAHLDRRRPLQSTLAASPSPRPHPESNLTDHAHDTPAPPAPPPKRSKLGAWLQLLRAPNLLTVPGDPLAGLCLASAAGFSADRPYLRMALAAAVSMLMYCAGLLFNDWFDLAEDLRDRPARPLPAGEVRPNSVAVAGSILLLGGLFVARVAGPATMYVALALAVMVLAYDGYLKRLRIVGPLAMGCCRGLSLLVGVAALGPKATKALAHPGLLAAAGGLTLYVAAVTAVAAGETRAGVGRIRRWLPAAAMLAWLAAMNAIFVQMLVLIPSAAAGILALGVTLRCAEGLRRDPSPATVQQTVGELIRALLLVQAAAVAVFAGVGWALAAVLAVFWPVNYLLARRFYAS